MVDNVIIITIIQSLLLLFIGTFVNVNSSDKGSKLMIKFLPMILGVVGLSVSVFEILNQ